MRFLRLTERDQALVAGATDLLRKRESEISSVSAGVAARGGNWYFGVCVDPPDTTAGMCAEYSAIGAMVSSGDRIVETMVAVTRDDGAYRVIPPCGKCRELARGLGNPYVIVERPGKKGSLTRVRLSELMPIDWKNRPL